MKPVVESIVDITDDPIECATYLQKYLNTLPEDDKYLESFLGLKALGYKFQGPYKETVPLFVVANGGYGLLPIDEKHRPLEEQRFEGRMCVLGRLATFDYASLDDNTSIVLRMSKPTLVDTYLVNDEGAPTTNFMKQSRISDFAITSHYVVPVLDIQQYHFSVKDSLES